MPKTLGRYEIVNELGKGGMGIVYLARNKETGEKAALKVLPPELARNPKYVERFRREAKAVSKLSHPNIIRIYDIGEQEGMLYFSMEYLAGPNLRQLIEKQGRLSVTEAVTILVQIADALEAAHLSGIVHRDIKPDNIMADETGKFKLMDFGIAHTEEGTRLTMTGTIMGTPEYMSPEQAAGTAIDPRTDIYSLGIVLYEMLTGKVPFKGQTAIEVLQMHRTKMPEPPKLINPDIPGNLADVLAKMIEKQPADRYSSFRHVINAISRIVPEDVRIAAGATAKEVKPSPAQKEAPRSPRVRERVILQAPITVRMALITSIILNAVLFGYLLFKRNQMPQAAEPMQPVFSIGGQVFAPPAVFANRLILAAEDGAVRAVDVGTGSSTWTFKTGDKITAAPLVHGNIVYLGSWDQHMYALNAEDGGLIWKTHVGGCIFSAPVLSNGVLYVCTREGNVLAIDAEGGGQIWQNATKQRTTFSAAVHEGMVYVAADEGKLIALRAADGFRLGELQTGRPKTSLVNFGQNACLVAFDDSTGRDALDSFTATPAQFTLTGQPIRKSVIEQTAHP